ncbi:MAG TPA: class I SAM-dependent methyltransferase [Solirubrobacteraceae bacterium]|nr:class I SAM-dependent methyltransferase [Solirubrobacteraceae bacterium]
MTVISASRDDLELVDPFEFAVAADAPTRPRALSYVGRWGRARRWLGDDVRRVLDVGCSFGYGSAAVVAGGPVDRVVVGVERDRDHLAMAARHFPWISILDADATALPIPDSCADAVLLLDVIEHIARPELVLDEVQRVLRPGGTVVVSIPHHSPLRWLDALNLYSSLRRRYPSLPPLEPATESDGGPHRHYTAGELTELLAPRFTVDAVARTGLGLQELVALLAAVIRVGLRAPRLARLLEPLHLFVYVVDDLLPTGPLAYHLAVRARAPRAA